MKWKLYSFIQPFVSKAESLRSPRSISPSTENCPVYVGMYDLYEPNDDILNFRKGDLMYVINTDNNDWWFACLKESGKKGYIPSNYVASAEYTKE